MLTEWMNIMFHSVSEGVGTVDSRRCFLSLNPAMQAILGRGPEKLLGRVTCAQAFGCTGVRGCPFGKAGMISGGRRQGGRRGVTHETIAISDRGGRRDLWLNCSPLPAISPLSPRVIILARDITRRKRTLARLRHLAVHDGLTGLFNHRYFFKRLIEEINRSRRYGHPVSVLMADIDGFKDYNDARGHYEGDRLLVRVARIFTAATRAIDCVGRYGGEEFGVILPETTKEGACPVAEKLRRHVSLALRDGPSISIGVAALPQDAEDAEGLITRADRALYRAKREGKDRVCSFGLDDYPASL